MTWPALLVLAGLCQAAEPELFLPQGASAAWVVAPAGQAGRQVLRWTVDGSGRPWLGRDGKEIVGKKLRFGVAGGFTDFLALKKALVFATQDDLALIPAQSADASEVVLQPLAKLPVEDARLFPAQGTSFYILGKSRGGKESEVYLRRGRSFKKLFSTEGPVAVVAGDGWRTFVAVDRVILEVKAKEPEVVFMHPDSDITSLAYGPAGLFYATRSGVGRIGSKGALMFIKAAKPQLCLRGDSLFVLLEESLGVVKVMGLKALGGWDVQ